MVRVKYQIELHEGVKVDLLFTLSMYEVARKRDMKIVLEDSANNVQVIEFYQKIIYIAALNAWEVNLFDHPSIGEFPYTFMDFVEWSQQNSREFGKLIVFAAEAISGGRDKDGEVKKK